MDVPLKNRFEALTDEKEVDPQTEDESEDDLSDTKSVENLPKRKESVSKESASELNERIDTLIQENVSENEQELQNFINIASLLPEQLLVIKIEIDGIQTIALLDTGADNNLMRKSICQEAKLKINKEKTIAMRGIGTENSTTEGRVRTDCTYYGMKARNLQFEVVDDDAIGYPIILSRKFCDQQNLVLNVKRRKISKVSEDGSRITVYLNAEDEGSREIIQENVKVYAAEKCLLKPGVNELPVSINYLNDGQTDYDLYFDGKCPNFKVEAFDGVINTTKKEQVVWVKKRDGETGNICVKKGDVVGTISTMVELDAQEKEDENENSWTLEELTKILDIGNLSTEQRVKVLKNIFNTKNALSKGEFDIGKAKVTPHQIELTDYTPIWQKPRRFADPINTEISKQCDELELLDIIEKCNSPWFSPVVPVRKSDGSLRLCIDYRKVNKVTKQENFPMPNLSNAIYSAHNVKYFTKLDLVKGYYKVPIHPNSRPFTSFTTHQQQYQFKRLSFGLRNSGLQFQKNMQEILSEFRNKRIIVYLDDILIMSESFEEHEVLVEKVLRTLMVNGIKIKVDKCEFFKQEVTFLGHIISNSGIKKSPEFIDKITNYPKPSNITELRQFLGLANFQRKFIDKFSVIAKPLTCLTGGPKRKQLQWTTEMTESFEALKKKLAEDLSLAFPDYREGAAPLELYVDASGVGAGSCLMQKQGEEYRPIAYSSTAISETEQKYSTIERELLALRWGVKNFRSFLFGVKFIIHTDHKPLLYLHNMSRDNPRLMRTLNDLEEYNYTINYIPGSDNQAADTMSRIIEKISSDDSAKKIENELPNGFRVMEKIEGGGDTMFKALLMVIEDLQRYTDDIDAPKDHVELRKDLVEYLFAHASKFKIKVTKDKSKQLKAMKRPGTLPCEEVLLAACAFFKMEVWVHHGMSSPVIYKVKDMDHSKRIAHLQCIAGIHFNPLMEVRKNKNTCVKEKNINIVQMIDEKDERETSEETQKVNIQVDEEEEKCQVHNYRGQFCNLQTNIDGVNFCIVVDTGAEISAIAESLWEKIKENDGVKLEETQKKYVGGIGKARTQIIGITRFSPKLLNLDLDIEIPFAVIKSDHIPCCCIFGANLIAKNNLIIDFFTKQMYAESADESINVLAQDRTNDIDEVEETVGTINLHSAASENNSVHVTAGERNQNNEGATENKSSDDDNDEDDDTDNDDTDDDDNDDNDNDNDDDNDDDNDARTKVKYVSNKNLEDLQKNNNAIRMLTDKMKNNVNPRNWREPYLKQYKRYKKSLAMKNNILIRCFNQYKSTVIPFPLLVEVVHKTHVQLGHIGMYKLKDTILKSFWHPSLDKTIQDICASCPHCQIFKISKQTAKPPIFKIEVNHPFELIATDVMLLPKTPRNNIAVLVTIDHYSKWLNAVPIKNKKASTITKVFNENVLPNLPRLPEKVISDNGPEFKSQEFNDLLQHYNIQHTYSTPYKASSNGCVERSNRTITELLKGIVDQSKNNWDLDLAKALIIHNSTIHSKIGKSPSDCLLKHSYSMESTIPIDDKIKETWKTGHPKFTPFEEGQKVLKKIVKVGNRISHKLTPKFDGPYKII